MRRTSRTPWAWISLLAVLLAGCASTPPSSFMTDSEQLTPCSSAPHCVSSQAEPGSSKYVEPLAFAGASVDAARQALLKTLYAENNATVERADERFVHATFKSTLGFVDDVTFVIRPQDRLIDVKSSSRIGYYDFGVNRKRVATLRAHFEAQLDRR